MIYGLAMLGLSLLTVPSFGQDPFQSAPGPASVRPAPRPRPAPAVTPSAGPRIGPAPGRSFRDCADCPEMVVIPSGSFMMGTSASESDSDSESNERPRHAVTVRSAFAVGKYHVTRGEYARFVQATGYSGGTDEWRNPGFSQTDRDPVVGVSWDDAKAYVAWLARVTGKGYRLPSEAEWEYAARAGTTKARYWGDDIGRNNANCAGCGSAWDDKSTSPVGSFAPNRFGLYDMLGNADQLVEDCWNGSYANAPGDASVALASGECFYRVARGGSWGALPFVLRASDRHWVRSGDQNNYTGFRVARTQ